MRKKNLKLRAKIHCTPREGAKQPAIEPEELLLMMQTLFHWVSLDHRHKTFLSQALITVAVRIMELQADKTHWRIRSTWPLLAFWMGIDTKYFTVIDPLKFKWFWYQLGETGRFTIKRQQQLLASGKEPPEMEPLIITKPYWTPKIKQQKLHAEAVKEYQNNSMHDQIMEHFFV